MIDTRSKIAAAYKRGASDMLLYLRSQQEPPFPKPDVERYLAELDAKPIVARFGT